GSARDRHRAPPGGRLVRIGRFMVGYLARARKENRPRQDAMATLRLTLACGDYDRTLALKTGVVQPAGVELDILNLTPEDTFYRMGRFREFDVSEFSLSTYTVLRGRGEPLIAIPVFPSFMFRHGAIFVRDDAGIREPGDLRGKRIGVPKYHMTAAVWVRGILEDEYGVAPKDCLWFEGGEGTTV